MTEDLIFKLSTISKTIQSALDFDRASKVKESIPVSGGSQITPPIWPTRYCLENWIEALDQACAELRDKQWQPIETAPRDGTVIFVARDMGEFGWMCAEFLDGYRMDLKFMEILD